MKLFRVIAHIPAVFVTEQFTFRFNQFAALLPCHLIFHDNAFIWFKKTTF